MTSSRPGTRVMQANGRSMNVEASKHSAVTPFRFASLRLADGWRPSLWNAVGVARFIPGMRRFSPPASAVLPPVLGRIGSLEVRLARTPKDIRRAQRLRYRVFFEEGAAVPSAAQKLVRRDGDAFDAICDHLLVIDHDARSRLGKKKPRVVGTYRLLRQEQAELYFGFYSAAEFQIGPLLAGSPQTRFLELGRSCVLKSHRGKRTVELLWHGLWQYVLHHRIDVMLGCACLDGADPVRLALPLSYLHHYARSPDEQLVRAQPSRFVAMNRIPKEQVNVKAALRSLPPLVKAYLRAGATFGEGAVVDRQFGTTDVFVMIRIADIDSRYIEHYGAIGMREAA